MGRTHHAVERFGTMNPNGAAGPEGRQKFARQKRRRAYRVWAWTMQRGQIVSHCALLAEPDRALRDLMHRTLAAAGYQVFESSNLLQLEVGLRVRTVFGAKNLLFVVGARLATQCALSISAAGRERARVRLPQAQVIVTYEFGTLVTVPRPDLAPCLTRGLLEKPFDLLDLQAMALECWRSSVPSGANGASA